MSDDMVDGRADPWRKDIFVEVDWMSGHKMMNEARWKVASQFIEHDIWLHMDDGNMGGGEEINHIEKIASSSDTYTDINDLKSNYFDNNRQGKFHYCVFGHYTYSSDDEKYLGVADDADFIVGDKLIDERDSMQDWLSTFGFMFCLFDENIDSSNYQAHVFMHELGHNLIGVYDPDGNYFGHDPEADHLIDTDSEDNFKEHCTDSNCALQTNLDPWENKPIDYCSDCWYALKLDWCF